MAISFGAGVTHRKVAMYLNMTCVPDDIGGFKDLRSSLVLVHYVCHKNGRPDSSIADLS